MVCAGLLLAAGVALWQSTKFWTHPAAFWWMFWSGYCFVVSILGTFVSSFQISINALVWICLANFAFAGGAILGSSRLTARVKASRGDRTTPVEAPRPHDRRPLASAISVAQPLILLIGIGIIAVLWLWVDSGGELRSLLSLDSIGKIASENTRARYNLGLPASRFAGRLNAFNYCGCALAGIWLPATRTNRERVLCVMPVALCAVFTVIATTRASFLFGLTLMLCGYLAGSTLLGTATVRKISAAFLAKFLVLSSAVVVAFTGMRLFRHDGLVPTMADISAQLITARSNFLGPIVCFSRWLDGRGHVFSSFPGEKTFYGAIAPFGFGERVQGVYTDFTVFADGTTSNIYTIHRGLIEDFGMLGALLMLFLFGALAGHAYARVRKGSKLWTPVLAASYITAIWGIVVSPWVYSTLVMTPIVCTGLLWLDSRGYYLRFPSNGRRMGPRRRCEPEKPATRRSGHSRNKSPRVTGPA